MGPLSRENMSLDIATGKTQTSLLSYRTSEYGDSRSGLQLCCWSTTKSDFLKMCSKFCINSLMLREAVTIPKDIFGQAKCDFDAYCACAKAFFKPI